MRYPFTTSLKLLRFWCSMLLVAILAAIGAGSYFAAIVILTINVVALLSYFAARWTRRHYAVLTPDSLRVKFGFEPPVVIPYDIISGVNTRPAGFFASQYVLLKLRRWRWQLLFPLPLLVPSRRFNVPVANPEGLARELRLRANLPATGTSPA
jgi:hypothetical protein